MIIFSCELSNEGTIKERIVTYIGLVFSTARVTTRELDFHFWLERNHYRHNALTPLQSKLASISAARSPKLWHWIPLTNDRSRLIMKNSLTHSDRFTYLGSIISRDGGTDLDIQSRLNKARNLLNMMSKVWRSSTYSTRTKLKLYHSCVLTTLLYGSECWRLTEKDLSKLSTFHTKSLRRILRIFWPNVISNKDLLERCGTEPMATILMRRRWRWIGHVNRQEASIAKTALH